MRRIWPTSRSRSSKSRRHACFRRDSTHHPRSGVFPIQLDAVTPLAGMFPAEPLSIPGAAMAATRVFGRKNRTIVVNDPDVRVDSGGTSARPEVDGERASGCRAGAYPW
jgi:hypothetical protein